jgi:predicted ATPase
MRRRKANTPGPFLLEAKLLRERIADPNQFPYCLPAIGSIDTLPFHPKVTFFVGENGSGKSTLLGPNDIMFHPPWDSGDYST